MASPELTKLSIDNAPTTPDKITTEGQAAAGRIAAVRAAKNAGATTPQLTNTQTPITSESLKPTPQATLATAPQAVAVDGMMAEFEDSVSENTKKLQEQAKAAEAPTLTSFDAFLNQLRGAKGEVGFTNDAYAVEGGVNDITPELNDINDKIRREQLALRRASESIQSKGGGLAGGAAAEIQNLERESFAKQADLSIIQMAVQGRYDSAKEIADRAVSAQLEQQTNQLEVARFNYEENKELFTKAEQRAFEAEQGDRERALAAQAETLKAVKELGIRAQIEGDAPTDVVQRMMAAETEAEAMAIGGQYIGALDREQQRASIEASRASTAQGWASLDIRRQELQMSKDKLAAEMAETGNQYGTFDGKPQTATQALVNSYANRLTESESVLDAVADDFAGDLAFGGSLPNLLQSDKRQQYEQAKRNFVNAVLRRESGAVISPDEFSNADKQYFPQAGDSPAVVLQKEANRNTVINNFYREANVPRPVFSGDIIESNGVQYEVGADGVTLIPL
jgi:hypothetical protein